MKTKLPTHKQQTIQSLLQSLLFSFTLVAAAESNNALCIICTKEKKIMYRESEAKRKRSDPFPRSQKGIDCIQNRHCTTPHHRNENNDSRNVSHLLHRHSLRVNVQHTSAQVNIQAIQLDQLEKKNQILNDRKTKPMPCHAHMER